MYNSGAKVLKEFRYTRWFKYDRDWFVCKKAALRISCATLREWSHNLHPPSCSGRTCSVLSGSCYSDEQLWLQKKISPGHIWTTLYITIFPSSCLVYTHTHTHITITYNLQLVYSGLQFVLNIFEIVLWFWCDFFKMCSIFCHVDLM